MSSLGLDFDEQLVQLESEWREVYEDSIRARADYHLLAADSATRADSLDLASERLEKAEALKFKIMMKIERLEIEMAERNSF